MRPTRRSPQMSLNFDRQGHGDPLVLLHGIGGELCVWEPVRDLLSQRAEVIAVDLPGFGRSPSLSRGVAPTPRALADAVTHLLDQLGIRRQLSRCVGRT